MKMMATIALPPSTPLYYNIIIIYNNDYKYISIIYNKIKQQKGNNNNNNNNINNLENMKCDVGMMIDCDVVEKRYKNKVGMSSY